MGVSPMECGTPQILAGTPDKKQERSDLEAQSKDERQGAKTRRKN
jgi:hypothetical protein